MGHEHESREVQSVLTFVSFPILCLDLLTLGHLHWVEDVQSFCITPGSGLQLHHVILYKGQIVPKIK